MELLRCSDVYTMAGGLRSSMSGQNNIWEPVKSRKITIDAG